MKKALSLILSILLITAIFSACSAKSNSALTEENVTATVDAAFTALKEFDTEALEKYVDSQTLDLIMDFAKGHEQFTELGKAMFGSLTYEIKSIDLENKTVTVTVNNKELAGIAGNFTRSLLKDYSNFELLASLKSDLWLDNNLSVLTEQIAAANMTRNGIDITLSITQEKKNLVLSFDDEAENAVSGGALSAIKDLI